MISFSKPRTTQAATTELIDVVVIDGRAAFPASDSSIFCAIGTSGEVWPAAGFVQAAAAETRAEVWKAVRPRSGAEFAAAWAG